MSTSSAAFLEKIHTTKAVSIWNRHTGPVFWYAAAIPGPFYVNTEMVIGADLSKDLLEKITAILAETKEPKDRAVQLEKLIMDAYHQNEGFRDIIQALAERLKDKFSVGSFDLISGGERRDWLFSIPLAKLCGFRHLYLFKDHTVFSAEGVKKDEVALHVSDLINNAASYFDAWLPTLTAAGLKCMGTLCVNSRGSNGVDRLLANGQKVVAMNSIDVTFFEESEKNGLIDRGTLDEIRVFFGSSKEWASKYLLNDVANINLFNLKGLDKKSMERLVSFFEKDPWALKPTHETFFAAMASALKAL